jgi:hypothetical protein
VRSKNAILRVLRASSDPLDKQVIKHPTMHILRFLLKNRVFEIEEAAKLEFPELWAASPQEQRLGKTSMEGSRASRVPTELEKSVESPGLATMPHGRLFFTTSEIRVFVSHACR